MSQQLEDLLGEIIINARNTSIALAKGLMDGKRMFKSPDEDGKFFISFIESMNEDQKKDFPRALRYCLDISFQILMLRLSRGEGPIDFEIYATMENERELLSYSADLNKCSFDFEDAYLDWLDKYNKN